MNASSPTRDGCGRAYEEWEWNKYIEHHGIAKSILLKTELEQTMKKGK